MSDVQLPIVVTGGALPDDTVTLSVGGKDIVGWTEVRVTRRAEGCTNDFEVGLTASNPDSTPLLAYAGQACVVKIGGRPVITGWIDRDTNEAEKDSHRLSISGRGKCCDLVDCTTDFPGGQINGSDALQVVSKLAEPYGITVVRYPGTPPPKPIPQINISYTETPQSIIDRVCTYSGLLYYEDEAGDLVSARLGTDSAASGFIYGQNVQAWSVQNAMDQRFSEYASGLISTFIYGDTGQEVKPFVTKDKNVTRYRNFYIVAEAVTGSEQLAEQRALWEAARRAGRGTVVTVTADSWRDSAGTLWTPNTLAPVTLPGLRLPAGTNLVISEVTYTLDLNGGHLAQVILMPAAAFTLEPIVIQPAPVASGE